MNITFSVLIITIQQLIFTCIFFLWNFHCLALCQSGTIWQCDLHVYVNRAQIKGGLRGCKASEKFFCATNWLYDCALAFQLSYVRTYHSKLTKIKQDMNSIEDRVGRLQVREGSGEVPFFYFMSHIIYWGPLACLPTRWEFRH